MISAICTLGALSGASAGGTIFVVSSGLTTLYPLIFLLIFMVSTCGFFQGVTSPETVVATARATGFQQCPHGRDGFDGVAGGAAVAAPRGSAGLGRRFTWRAGLGARSSCARSGRSEA